MKSINRNNLTKIICIILVMFISAPAVFADTPDNAALIYYQAFLLYEKPDETMSKMLADFHDGKIGANEVIGQYIEENRKVIDFIVTAADTPYCDWGYDYSQGLELVMPNLAQLRRMTYLIEADAKLLGEQGDYKTALDRCLSMHKMALHAADRTLVGYLVAIAISARANTAIAGILKDTSEDPDILNWLKERLIHIKGKFPSLKDHIAYEAEVCAATMQKDKAQAIVEMAPDEEHPDPNMIERILGADEAFFERSRNYYMSCITSVQAVLDTPRPYPQTYAKLGELEKQVSQEAEENPDAALTAMCLPAVNRVYSLSVREKTHSNAIRTAIEIYSIKAKTGRLPDALPAGLPKDLFSGKDFEYRKTESGFVLRCQAKESNKDEVNQYDFKVSG